MTRQEIARLVEFKVRKADGDVSKVSGYAIFIGILAECAEDETPGVPDSGTERDDAIQALIESWLEQAADENRAIRRRLAREVVRT